jgi:quinol monooxygenase YgiN
MYARVMTFHYQPGNLDKAIQFVRDSVLPELKQEEGFQEFRMLVDQSKDKVLGIALYQTEAHLQAAGTHFSHPTLQRRASKIRSSFAAEPLAEIYEVVLQG